ncbi:MAG: ComEC/Rec2 family competence protein [Verrucomicrobiae bacterium]|nr:ComEC/Rec2 family competence protein [Verrucomicrobiae bacterium]NNJ44056.1 DUF4131 domain-containing protein [Akkermansiaceae bacterium]
MRAPTPLDRLFSLFPLWPLLTGVIAGVCWADKFGTGDFVLAAIIGIITLLCFRKLPITLLVLGALLGHVTHGLVINHQATWLRTVQAKQPSANIALTGVVIQTLGPTQGGPYLIKVRDAEDLPSGVRILLNAKRHAPLKYGDIINLNGTLHAVTPRRNPHGFDRAAWLHRLGADLTLETHQAITVTGVSPIRKPVRILTDWRHHLRKKMTTGLDPDSEEAQLIRAVVLGERPPRDSKMIENFRNSGALHVFAVSGLHVGMVGTLIGGLLWFLRAPRWALISGIILGMALYAGITGLRPPAVRAVLMASIFLSGFLIQRRPSLINSLAASAIIVLLGDGHQIFTPGFQLSYGVLLALAVATGLWIQILKPMAEIDPFMPRLLLTPWQERILSGRKWLRNSLSVSLAAWMGSAPLIWIHFGIITPIGILAGIPLMLIVFLILALAMLGLAAGSLWEPAGKAVTQANAIVAHTAYHAATFFAHIPGGHHYHQPHRPPNGRIIVFDLPYGGGANFLDLGGGILLDCGRRDHFTRHVQPTLNQLRLTPDSLIVSHADSKHSGGMSHCLASFQPKQAIIPRSDLLSQSYRTFLSQAKNEHCRLVIPHANQIFHIEPGVYLEILHAPVEIEGHGLADDSGLVIRLHWHGWRILFTGDAGMITETRLLDSGKDLSADLIVMGRNSDDFTGSQIFYQAVTPQAIITSNCPFPARERIPERWIHLTQKLGIHTFDQLQTGAVTLTLEHDQLTLTPTLDSTRPITLKH